MHTVTITNEHGEVVRTAAVDGSRVPEVAAALRDFKPRGAYVRIAGSDDEFFDGSLAWALYDGYCSGPQHAVTIIHADEGSRFEVDGTYFIDLSCILGWSESLPADIKIGA